MIVRQQEKMCEMARFRIQMGEKINHQRKEDELEGKIGNNKSTVKSLEDQNEENKQNERIWE